VKNLGEANASFTTYFRIESLGTTIYQNSIAIVDLPVNRESTLVFTEWPKPHAIGSYATKCTTALAGDNIPANNAQSGSFTITAAPPPPSETGWVRKADLPLGPKSKKVKDGGCLAYSSDSSYSSNSIYAFKGNNRCEFYKYNTQSNVWAAKESIPAVGATGKKKAVKKGGSLAQCVVSHKLYATKGNNTTEFWEYDPGLDAYPWTEKAPVPTGSKNVKEGTGAVSVQLGDTNYIYLLKGSGTQEFYRYNTSTNTWETRENVPLGASNKTWKNGSCLAYDGANTIYALKGSYNEFFSYSCSTNAWTSLASLPLIGAGGKKKKVKDGAGLAYHAGDVYAQKGGNTFEFWTYAVDSHKWVQYPDVPLGTGKKVKGGGALCASEDALYEFKGNNTLDFFKYGFSAVSSQFAAYSPNEMSNSSSRTPQSTLRIAPNPFSTATAISYSLPRAGDVSLKLYDVTGQLIRVLASGYHNAGASSFVIPRSLLSSGIYVLKLVTENSSFTEKIIIE
jgi:N-acetylneuraminic acid mutarotase